MLASRESRAQMMSVNRALNAMPAHRTSEEGGQELLPDSADDADLFGGLAACSGTSASVLATLYHLTEKFHALPDGRVANSHRNHADDTGISFPASHFTPGHAARQRFQGK